MSGEGGAGTGPGGGAGNGPKPPPIPPAPPRPSTALPPVALSPEQAAGLLGGVVTGRWLNDRAAAGDIPCLQLGKARAFTPAHLESIAALFERPARDSGQEMGEAVVSELSRRRRRRRSAA